MPLQYPEDRIKKAVITHVTSEHDDDRPSSPPSQTDAEREQEAIEAAEHSGASKAIQINRKRAIINGEFGRSPTNEHPKQIQKNK